MPIKCNCLICGTEFKTSSHRLKNGRGKFCSKKCFYKHKNKQIECVCVICGKKFSMSPSYVKRGEGKYCSRYCWGKSISLNRVGENNPCWKGATKICEQCGKEFNTIPSEIKRGKKYCSDTCQAKAYSERYKKEGNPAWKNGSIYTNCVICGKPIRRSKSDKPGLGRYCSNECKGIWMSQNRSGINHWNYQNGKSREPYPIEWNDELKRRIREYFGNKCVVCGKTPIETKEESLCHHVNYDKKAPKQGEEITDFLYVTLCRSCHGKINKKDSREQWRQHFIELINTKYNGRCYYTKEEIIQNLPLLSKNCI